MTSIQFVSRPTFRDIAGLTIDQSFRSFAAQAMHGFGWGVVVYGVLSRLSADIWVPPAFLGIVFGTGCVSLFFQWWTYGRRPELLIERVTADSRGVLIEGPESQVRQAWTVYRDARETPDLFHLRAVRTLSQVLAKRGVSDADVEAFRGLLRGAGLYRDRSSRSRAVAGFGTGLVLAIVLPFVLGTLAGTR